MVPQVRPMSWRCSLCVGLALLLAGCTKPLSSNDFVTGVIQGDISAVRLGHLAGDNATGPHVRKLGEMIANDRRESEDKAEALAAELGAPVPDASGQTGDEEYNKLLGLSGKAFDVEFMRFVIQQDTGDIATLEQAARGSDKRVAGFARDALPALRRRLKAAEAYADQEKSGNS
jgi:putative membrane protein